MVDLSTSGAVPAADPATLWTAWVAAPSSGFKVRHKVGRVGLSQMNSTEFLVQREFCFENDVLVSDLLRRVTSDLKRREARKQATERLSDGAIEQAAHSAVEDARTFTPSDENPTDLASIPRFMRWFETSYGLHTLAAIIHDNLIREEPNSGALASDTLSDRFFREMMKHAGVPWLKRWIIWSAVAMRSRWAVGGLRRISVVIWVLLAVVGMSSTVGAVGSATLDWFGAGIGWTMAAVAVLLPVVAAGLWGRQYGAGIVAALAALWILPPALVAGIGYAVYLLLERTARAFGLD